MLLKKNDFLIFLGDSITDCSKHNELGEGHYVDNPLGYGFPGLVFSYLRTQYPNLQIRIANKGISGNRTFDLLERFSRDVLDLKPTYLAIMIGVNDAWRMFDYPDMPQYKITDEMYENNLVKMINLAQQSNIKVILMNPFMMEINKNEPMMQVIERYSCICKKLADEYNLIFIDIQKAFDEVLKNITTHEISRDKIHPNLTGHMLIAMEFIKKIEKEL